jgi:hypothetical protein
MKFKVFGSVFVIVILVVMYALFSGPSTPSETTEEEIMMVE